MAKSHRSNGQFMGILAFLILTVLFLGSSIPVPKSESKLSISPGDCSVPVDKDWIAKVSRIRWVTYSSPNPNPDGSYYRPPAETIYRDLLVLRKAGFTGLVTYGSSGIMGKEFLVIADSLGFRGVIMGIWNPMSQVEIDNAREASSLPIVLGYSIGNEGLFRAPWDRYTIAELCGAISNLRASTGKPVTTSEESNDYAAHLELLLVGDWIFPNAHPYWHSTKYALKAVEWEKAEYKKLGKMTNRFIFFKEVGLPTDGAYGLSESNLDLYYRKLAKTNVHFVYFEGFDQPTKVHASVEAHWGIFNADRTPKLPAWNLMGYQVFKSEGIYDGWILECSETSGNGCIVDSASTVLIVGDDSQNRQYRAFLSFDTSDLPDNAVITGMKLKLKYTGYTGLNPFNTNGNLKVDTCLPVFGTASELQKIDFQAEAGCGHADVSTETSGDGWYVMDFSPDAFQYINLVGRTQVRLRLGMDDNNDNREDIVEFYSGDGNELDRPILVVAYNVP